MTATTPGDSCKSIKKDFPSSKNGVYYVRGIKQILTHSVSVYVYSMHTHTLLSIQCCYSIWTVCVCGGGGRHDKKQRVVYIYIKFRPRHTHTAKCNTRCLREDAHSTHMSTHHDFVLNRARRVSSCVYACMDA